MAKDNGNRLWSAIAWVATSLVVALATLVFLWINSVQSAAADNHIEIVKIRIERAVADLDLKHIKEGIDELRKSVGRLEDKFGTKPE